MRKTILLFILLLVTSLGAQAQKFALIDMEYILEKIPAYAQANQQLEQLSKQRQAEVEKATQEAKNLYDSYQKALKTLSDAQRTQREEAIIQKEKTAAELRRSYFGPEGELAKKRNELMQPIEDRIYEAVKKIATARGYAAVIDRASASSLIFASPDIDISNEVLSIVGYSN